MNRCKIFHVGRRIIKDSNFIASPTLRSYTAFTADPMTSRQLGRIGTTVLLGADEAVIGLTEDRGLASRAMASAVIWGQIFKLYFHLLGANIPWGIRASLGYLPKVRIRTTEHLITSAAFVCVAIVEEAASP